LMLAFRGTRKIKGRRQNQAVVGATTVSGS
jgi:hypothetical protein